MPLVARKLVLELLDLQRLRLCQLNQTFCGYAQFSRIGRQGFGRYERVSDILCMSNLVHASKLKEHEDNDDYQ